MPIRLRKGENKMNKEKVLCYWELEKGKIYDEFYDVIDHRYINNYELRNNGLFHLGFNDYSCRTMECIMKMKFVEMPWKPKMGESYYFVCLTKSRGYAVYIYFNDNSDQRILNRIPIYRTKEEVKKHIPKNWVRE